MKAHVMTSATPAVAKPRKPRIPRSAQALPRVLAAPGLLEQEHAVVREADDTDADYQSRSELFSLLIGAARKS